MGFYDAALSLAPDRPARSAKSAGILQCTAHKRDRSVTQGVHHCTLHTAPGFLVWNALHTHLVAAVCGGHGGVCHTMCVSTNLVSATHHGHYYNPAADRQLFQAEHTWQGRAAFSYGVTRTGVVAVQLVLLRQRRPASIYADAAVKTSLCTSLCSDLRV